MSKSKKELIGEIKYSSKTHWSFGLGSFLDQFYVSSFTVRVIFYYENELFLSIVLIGIAFAIYGFWNMINDPLLGWFSDRKTRLTNRWGRRFPWFVVGAITINIVYFFIYLVPTSDQFGMFIWLLITICIFEFCYSLWQVNWLALYPDKFRSQQERTKVGAISTIWAQVGTVFGILIPPLFIKYGNVNSYIIAAIVVGITGFVFTLFLIPGMREDKELIERELRVIEEQKKDKESYWKIIRTASKQKNFVSYIFFYMFYYTVPLLLLSSLPFWVLYIIGEKEPIFETLLAGSFLIGGVIGVPLWLKVGRKIGNRKSYMYGSLLTVLFFAPMLFITDLTMTIIILIFLGLGYGGIWTLLYPGFSDTIDEVVVKTGKRREGAYTGIRTFIGRLAFVIQAVVFAVVHQITFYEPGAPTQAPLALWGIRIIMAVIPMVCFFTCFLLMAFVNDLTPEKVKNNREVLKEKNL
jgi:GPH family glycoside/pentoside/hexuronide:cation symporter